VTNSATKYIGGHADIIMGTMTTNSKVLPYKFIIFIGIKRPFVFQRKIFRCRAITIRLLFSYPFYKDFEATYGVTLQKCNHNC